MKHDLVKLRVGLFVMGGCALLIAALIVFGSGRLLRRPITVVTFFDESVQGLEPGSPVKWRGVRVGRVSRILLHSDAHLVRVEMHIDRSRFAQEAGGKDIITLFRQKVQDGLRCRLELTGITGLKYVEFDYFAGPSTASADAARNLPKVEGGVCVPSVPSTLSQLEETVTETVQRISAVDFDGISRGLQQLLENANRILGDPALPEALHDLRQSADELEKFARRLNEFADPVLLEQLRKDTLETSRNLNELAAELDRTVSEKAIDRILKNIEQTIDEARTTVHTIRVEVRKADVSGVSRDVRQVLAKTGRAADEVRSLRLDLRRTLAQLDATLAAVRNLVQDLRDNPSVLIRGRAAEESRP